MNDVNHNFLDNADEVIEEIEEIEEEEQQEADRTAEVLNEAMARIEQANLYKALLGHNLFAPGSARPEIIKAVKKEFKDFIQFRLEVLLGIRPDGKIGSHMGVSGRGMVSSPFDEMEVTALKQIASKLINRGAPIPAPAAPIQPPTPQIQALPPVQAQPEYHEPAPVTTRRTVTRRVVKRNGQIVDSQIVGQPTAAVPTATASKAPPRQKSNNLNPITGEDLGQAASPVRPPVPMPSQSVMNMLNAQQADKNARAAGYTQGSTLTKAIDKLWGE
jgi:hypothetical protein